MLSIIIPTLNEEKHLAKLLKSIEKQDFKNYEVIISDAGSKDKTLEIAKKYKCKIVKGGSPAQGRNNGAKIAKGERLLFLDADVILPNKIFGKILKEFKKRKLKIASFFITIGKRKKLSILFYSFLQFPYFSFGKDYSPCRYGYFNREKAF